MVKHSSVFHVVKLKLKRSSEKFSDDLLSLKAEIEIRFDSSFTI